MAELRVLQVLGSSAGGVARHVAQVAAAARATGVAVAVAGPGELGDRLSSGGVVPFRTVEIADRPGVRDAVAMLRLRRLAAAADVVHAHGLRAGGLTVLACRSLRHRPAVVVTLHNLPVGGRAVTAVAGVLESVVARGADTVLGVSGDLVSRARERGATVTGRALVPAPPHPAATVAPTEVREALEVGPGEHLLVTVARLAPQKGLDLLCDAAALLAASSLPGPERSAAPAGPTTTGTVGAGFVWVVAGDGPLQEDLAARISAQGLPVRLLGRRADVADLMGAADVVVSTALWEGQPLGVQEALALGAPLVATDVGGTREVTADAAVLVPAAAAAVADAIGGLLRDPERRRRLHEAALVRAGELPDLAATMSQLTAVWAEAAERARGGRRRDADVAPSDGLGDVG